MSALPVLLVEDDADLREALHMTLSRNGHDVISAGDGAEALDIVAERRVSMIISDVQMKPLSGLDLLERIGRAMPGVPFVLMTAFGSVGQAVSAMRHGAMDYLTKPVARSKLLEVVETYSRGETPDADFVAVDPTTRALVGLAERVASSLVTVLLTGPSGTGKEAFARLIHRQSERWENPFVAVNCAAIPEQMLEAELFGHEKGAFTGAVQARKGKFEYAQGGTLLLDEISEMDISLQAKLLRVLQESELERLGGNRTIPLDVRIIATSNRNLTAAVQKREFREDLFYRLNVFPIHLPPLAERPDDIVALAENSLRRHCKGQDGPPLLSADARRALMACAWPGNVRQLDNVMQRALVFAGKRREIHVEDLLLDGLHSGPSENAAETGAAELSCAQETPGLEGGLQAELERSEHDTIVEAMRALGGHRGKVAERLGISPRTLRYKLSRMRAAGIEIHGDGRDAFAAAVRGGERRGS